MILKESDPHPPTESPLLKAGRAAEAQMAFYLRREFGQSEKIFVFNDLRLANGNDAAQMDHLVVHRFGLIIIESKSVHGKVRVNQYGEWARYRGTRPEGMPSPIEQVKRQSLFLAHYLDRHIEEICGKVLGVQFRLGALATDYIVAISDSGIIDRPHKPDFPELCKADQTPAKARALIERQKKDAFNIFDLKNINDDRGRSLNAGEMDRLCQFLIVHHSSQRAVAGKITEPVAPPDPVSVEATTDFLCESPVETITPSAAPFGTCAVCGKEISEKVRDYCQANAERFQGRILCFNHQRSRSGKA